MATKPGSGPPPRLGPSGNETGNKYTSREIATDRDVWERQPAETEKAYSAFVEYVAMAAGERSVTDLGKRLGKLPTCEGWSRQWSWRARARAWDDHLMQQGREAQIEEVREMNRRHLELSRKMQNLVKVELDRMLHHLGVNEDGTGDPTQLPKLGTKEMAKLLDFAVRMERLNRGEAESVEEIRATSVSAADRRAVARKFFGTEQADELLDQLADLGMADV